MERGAEVTHASWRVTVPGLPPFVLYGRRDAIMDMCYDNGAMGVTIIQERQHERTSSQNAKGGAGNRVVNPTMGPA